MIEISGIKVPDSRVCLAATEYVQRVSAPFLYQHVLRTFMFGALVGQKVGWRYDAELFYLGAVFHDIALTDVVPVQSRFEVDGADAAQEFLVAQGMEADKVAIVWDAIALHTTAEIPQRKRPEIALVQTGAGIDVGVISLDSLPAKALEQVLEACPRLGFKRAMVELLASQVNRNPQAAMSSVVADAVERRQPDFHRFNVCDAISRSGFKD